MNYYSTNNKSLKVSLREAVIQGLAPDNGLFMPEHIPTLPKSFITSLPQLSFQEIGYEVAKNIIGRDIPEAELRKIVDHTIQFDAPIISVEDSIYSLELFHGPTLAFKDFGARFLSGLLGFYAQQQSLEITILVATSGDTGSAVANGFLNVPGTRVIVLYPSGKVSDVQEKQFTTLGGNITALEIDGTFDDCQHLVKQCFMDIELKQKLFLTSANSINIARLLPQSFYYFRAVAQLQSTKNPIIFSVPSGNFGNLTTGLMAKKMGLPIHKFIAATNSNNVVPRYLTTSIFSSQPSIATISNAMDVGNPSNFVRLLDLYGGNHALMSNDLIGCYFSDNETRQAMADVYRQKKYLLDPHGAIGYLGLKKYLNKERREIGIFLETAHPAKFKKVVDIAIHSSIAIPKKLQAYLKKEKVSIKLNNSFEELKQFLVD